MNDRSCTTPSMAWFEERRNQVISGDSRRVLSKIPEKSVDLILTDPPYGQERQSHRGKTEGATIISDSPGKATRLLRNCLGKMRGILKSDGVILVFSAFGDRDKMELTGRFAALLNGDGFIVRDAIVWNKKWIGSGDPHRGFRPMVELILVCTKDKAKYTWNEGHNIPNIILWQALHDTKNATVGNIIHPTEKPIGLLRKLINLYTKPGQIVLDPFAGCGSAVAAAKREGRIGVGIELDAKYTREAERRLADPAYIWRGEEQIGKAANRPANRDMGCRMENWHQCPFAIDIAPQVEDS